MSEQLEKKRLEFKQDPENIKRIKELTEKHGHEVTFGMYDNDGILICIECGSTNIMTPDILQCAKCNRFFVYA